VVLNPNGEASSNEALPYHRREVKIQCFPLYSVLKALNATSVDYFSLDVEGSEFPILKTIPWHKVAFKVLGIEVTHLGKVFDGDRGELEAFLSSKGFKYRSSVGDDAFYVKSK